MSLRNWSKRPNLVARLIPVVLSFGILSVYFGSAYYHWAPENHTLVWDRLPMTLLFMSMFSLIVYDFVGKGIGKSVFWISVPLGIASVFYWQYTESIGQGDLRLYLFVQFFPMIITPFVLWLFPKKAPYIKWIVLLLVWYVAAKVCERFDKEIFEFLGFWSGHTVKHLLSSVTLFYALMLTRAWERELVAAQP